MYSVSQSTKTRISTPVGNWRKQKPDEDPSPEAVKTSKEHPSAGPSEKPRVPFLVTVMGEGGKLLLNLVTNKPTSEIQIFYNLGRQEEGIQSSRSCLRNMLSIEVNDIICVNSFKGYYLAIQSNHNDHNTRWYQTDPKYKSKIGKLEYVALNDIKKFSEFHQANIGPKIVNYFDELENYFHICRGIAKELDS